MHLINADLHSHSTVSDGTLAPEALAARARVKGVALWSLTDHDSLAGQARARDAAIAQGIGYLSGIELSAGFIGRSVHVVGLGFDADERVYLPAAQMLRLLGFDKVRLMTNNPLKVDALTACGVEVAERVAHAFPSNKHNEHYLKTKATRGGHMM